MKKYIPSKESEDRREQIQSRIYMTNTELNHGQLYGYFVVNNRRYTVDKEMLFRISYQYLRTLEKLRLQL